MTDLTTRAPGLQGRRTIVYLLTGLLLTVSLAGCIGDDDSQGDGDVPAFRVFLAASGDQPTASATVSEISVTLNETQGQQVIPAEDPEFDLASLATSGQAILAAASTDINASVSHTTVVFSSLTVGSTTLTDVELAIPLDYTAAPGVDATVTLALDKTSQDGEVTLQHLVVERGDQQLAAITGTELESGERQDIPEMARPTIIATQAGTNDTAPSFEINSDVNFTIDIEEKEGASVRQVFWSFPDGSTTQGRNVTHAFRAAGLANVTVIAEGTRGQQVTASGILDIYWTTDGEGNVLAGSGGQGQVEGRDTKNHSLAIPGPFSDISLRTSHSPSGGACSEDENVTSPTGDNVTVPGANECAPSNIHIELYDPTGKLVAENKTDARTKYINETTTGAEPFPDGKWELRVKGDQGAAIGYTYDVEVHYLGLLCEAGAGGEGGQGTSDDGIHVSLIGGEDGKTGASGICE